MRSVKSDYLMATGLLPLLGAVFISLPPYLYGWVLGTYPLLVIAFIAGMQFNATKRLSVKTIAMLYPVLVSLVLLQYGDAVLYYSIGLVMSLVVDSLLWVEGICSKHYLVIRGLLVALFILLLSYIGWV